MGGEHKLNLTSDVTHLLVEVTHVPTVMHLTEKYKYVAANREDIRVLQPEWLEAVRQSWMTVEKFNLQALEEKYKLPIFTGLSICLTGFKDCKSRVKISPSLSLQRIQRPSGLICKTVSLPMAVIINRPLPGTSPTSSPMCQRVRNTNMLGVGIFESSAYTGSTTASPVAWCWKKASTIQLRLSRSRERAPGTERLCNTSKSISCKWDRRERLGC